MYGSSNSAKAPGIDITTLLQMLAASGPQGSSGQPMKNAAPSFPLSTQAQGGGIPYAPVMPGALNSSQGQNGGGGDFISNLLRGYLGNMNGAAGKAGGKGGSAPTAMDMLSYGGLGDVGSANSIAALAGGFG